MIDIDVLSTAAGLQEFDAATVAEYCQTDEARVVVVLDEHGDLFAKRLPRHQVQPGSPRYRVLHPDALERRISAFSGTGGFSPWFAGDAASAGPAPAGRPAVLSARTTDRPTVIHPSPVQPSPVQPDQSSRQNRPNTPHRSDGQERTSGPGHAGAQDRWAPSDRPDLSIRSGPSPDPARPIPPERGGEPDPGPRTGRPRPPRSGPRPRRPERGDLSGPRTAAGTVAGGYTSGGYLGTAAAARPAAAHPFPARGPARPTVGPRPTQHLQSQHSPTPHSPTPHQGAQRNASGAHPLAATEEHAPAARRPGPRNPAPWNRPPTPGPQATESRRDPLGGPGVGHPAPPPADRWASTGMPGEDPVRTEANSRSGAAGADRLEVIHSRDPQPPDPRLTRAENALLACAREEDPQARHTLASAAMSALSECVPNLPRDGELRTAQLPPRLRFALTLATLTLIESTGQPIARKLLVSAYDDATAAAVEFLPARQADLISRFRALASGRSADFRDV